MKHRQLGDLWSLYQYLHLFTTVRLNLVALYLLYLLHLRLSCLLGKLRFVALRHLPIGLYLIATHHLRLNHLCLAQLAYLLSCLYSLSYDLLCLS